LSGLQRRLKLSGLQRLSSRYLTPLRGLVRRWTKAGDRAEQGEAFDFGWGPGWMNGLAIAALLSLAAAVAIEVAVPAFWPAAFLLVIAAAAPRNSGCAAPHDPERQRIDVSARPSVILVVRVNGTGKTTTLRMIAWRRRHQGRPPVY
jgi:hypothetical protein